MTTVTFPVSSEKFRQAAVKLAASSPLRVLLDLAQARQVIERFTMSSDLPEPLRTAHLIAGGIQTGESRHRA